jgi:hypothetical protein
MDDNEEKREAALHAVLYNLEQAYALLLSKPSPPDMLVRLELLVTDAIDEMRTVLGIRRWPEPTVETPDLATLEEWLWEDGGCEATDGCWTDPDGICPHGHPSWLLRLGLI